jgi:hypothetical protein
VEKGDENCRINMGSLPYGIFVIYYLKQSIWRQEKISVK